MRPALVVALVSLLGLVGCGADDSRGGDESLLGDDTPSASPRSPAATTAAPASVAALLRGRAAAVRTGDRAAFLAPVRGPASFLAQQAMVFDNLSRLPLAGLAFQRRDGDVVRRLRFAGESAADEGPAGFDVRREGGEAVVVPGPVASAPWDLGPVSARTRDEVTVVADAAASDRVGEVLRRATDALPIVSVELGERPPPTVVIALGDPGVLDSWATSARLDLTGHDALTFPVTAGSATRRVALLPEALASAGPELSRLLRHELTHVALGPRADGAPLWLVEGIAEHVAWSTVPAERWRLPMAAVDRATIGLATLPLDSEFRQSDPETGYAIAWQAVEQVVADHGSDAPLTLLDATASDPDARVIRRLTGGGVDRLARRTGLRIARDFG